MLTFTTGLVDAVSYLGLGRVFTANMMGNIVLLGFAAVGAPGFSVTRSLIALGGFLVGAVFGGRLGTAMVSETKRRWLLTVAVVEAALIFAADPKHSVPEADRRIYAQAYAQPGADKSSSNRRHTSSETKLQYVRCS